MKQSLVSIQTNIDRRVSAILSEHGDWPCRAGCDHCCRHLASVPEITEPEWRQLLAGMNHLAEPRKTLVQKRIEGLDRSSRPFTCPFLDTGTGTCLTYDYRPIACRTYGFYVERDKGLYCDAIRSEVEAGRRNEVIWGNQAGVDERTAALGGARSLVEWFRRDSIDD